MSRSKLCDPFWAGTVSIQEQTRPCSASAGGPQPGGLGAKPPRGLGFGGGVPMLDQDEGGGGVVCETGGRSRMQRSRSGVSAASCEAGSLGRPSTLTKIRSCAMPPPDWKLIHTNIARPLMFSKGTPAPSPPRQLRESWLLLRLSPIMHTSSGATLKGPW